MSGAKHKQFDVILVEQTDRLSRRSADLHFLADQFEFDGVKIYTPGGPVSKLQLTFEGYQNEDFIAKLRGRVKSGHDDMARQGLIAGPCAYGYDCVLGQPGVRVINEYEANIVRRIFGEYSAGVSPRAIAADLTRDGIPSPSGSRHWSFQVIVGGKDKKRGILHNPLYIGTYLKNRFYNVKNPPGRRSHARPILTI
jgi:DNA invertase Pin-like site-specific DNA recombinase